MVDVEVTSGSTGSSHASQHYPIRSMRSLLMRPKLTYANGVIFFMRDEGCSHYIPSPNQQKTIQPADEVIMMKLQWSRKQSRVAGATDTSCGCGFDY